MSIYSRTVIRRVYSGNRQGRVEGMSAGAIKKLKASSSIIFRPDVRILRALAQGLTGMTSSVWIACKLISNSDSYCKQYGHVADYEGWSGPGYQPRCSECHGEIRSTDELRLTGCTG